MKLLTTLANRRRARLAGALALLAVVLVAVAAHAAEPGERVLFEGVTGIGAYVAVLGMLVLCGLGVPVPEDIILISGGYLASQSGQPAWPGSLAMVLTGLAGIMIGDSMIWALGRFYGLALVRRTVLSRVFTEQRLERTRELFGRHGEKMVMAARFMPGVRAVAFFSAGAMHVPYWKFFLFDGLAALVSAPLWVILGYVALERALQGAEQFKWVIVALMVGGVAFWLHRRYRASKSAAAEPAPQLSVAAGAETAEGVEVPAGVAATADVACPVRAPGAAQGKRVAVLLLVAAAAGLTAWRLRAPPPQTPAAATIPLAEADKPHVVPSALD